MKRSVLSPEQAAWLAQTFDRNRKYAGMRMEEGDGKTEDKADDAKSETETEDKPLGGNGEKALKAERERASAAEEANKALKSEFDGFKSALLEGLGIKSEDDKGKETDALATVQQQLAAIQRESAVLKLANTHKITDEGDLTILASATDAEQMKKLAERLAPKEQDSDAKSRNKPKPDRTQGGGDGSGASAGGSIAAHREQLAADRAAKQANSNV